jgi:aspartyl-tRNA(Asn)/glutamyl-tRNA(Gln) amidotransferase subunit A
MALRNTGTINVLDGCAISIPIHRAGEAPVGLMLAAARGRDAHLFQIAADIEAQLRPIRLS